MRPGLAVLLVLASGCFEPSLPAVVRCDNGDCPPGRMCSAGFCVVSPADAAVSDGPTLDASDDSSFDTGLPDAAARPNYIFVTSQDFAPTLGIAQADVACQTAADRRFDGTFIAWMSAPGMPMRDRLGNARGWVLPNGVPFADRAADLLRGVVYHHVDRNENGEQTSYQTIITGTTADGSTDADTCDGWTRSDVGSSFRAGSTSGGPKDWTSAFTVPCTSRGRIYCLEVSHDFAVRTPGATGKRMFLSNAAWLPSGGTSAADAVCNADKPAGVSAAVALLSTTTVRASTRLDMGALYVRQDGMPIGAGSVIATGAELGAGPWQAGDGSYVTERAWTGSNFPSNLSVSNGSENCTDWTSAAGDGGTGLPHREWWVTVRIPCGTGARLYCVEP